MDNKKLQGELITDEGIENFAYQDTLGYWTIGVGRLIDKRKGGGLSNQEILYLLQNDINDRVLSLSNLFPWFNRLSDNRQRVLVNMAFQLGTDGLLAFKKALSAMQSGDFETAANEMLFSKWAQQTPARAKRLAERMRVG